MFPITYNIFFHRVIDWQRPPRAVSPEDKMLVLVPNTI